MKNLGPTAQLLEAFGDPTRLRLLSLLSQEELTVAELVQVTELGQSRVSTHLARLKELELVRDRRAGRSSYYALNQGMAAPAERMWRVLSEHLKDEQLRRDSLRLTQLLAARRKAEPWLDSVAGRMERHYSPGRTWEATVRGLLGFVDWGKVVDLGSGDGAVAELIAPICGAITLVDANAKMVQAAERRLARFDSARVVHADLHELPFCADEFDQALLFNSLPYLERPALVLDEAARVLRPGGRLAIVCVGRHDHAETAARYGHVNHGFTSRQISSMLAAAGLVQSFVGVTSRERRPPFFEVISAFASKST